MPSDLVMYGGLIFFGLVVIIVAIIVSMSQTKKKQTVGAGNPFPHSGDAYMYGQGKIPAGNVGVYEIGPSNSGLLFGHPTLGNAPTYREKVGTIGKLNDAMYYHTPAGGVRSVDMFSSLFQ